MVFIVRAAETWVCYWCPATSAHTRPVVVSECTAHLHSAMAVWKNHTAPYVQVNFGSSINSSRTGDVTSLVIYTKSLCRESRDCLWRSPNASAISPTERDTLVA